MDEEEGLMPDDDHDLDPALRADAPGATPAPAAAPDPALAARLQGIEEQLARERDGRVRAETLLNAMHRQAQGTGPVVERPSDPTEAQYYDLLNKWFAPQLQ